MRQHEPETLAFCTNVKVAWMASRKTMRQCAKEVGCSHATFSRLVNSKQPDLDTYFKVKRWMGKQGDALEALKQLVNDASFLATPAVDAAQNGMAAFDTDGKKVKST